MALGRNIKIGIVLVVVVLIVAVTAVALFSSNSTINSSKEIQVVAAENFWGSLASQIGGNNTQVLSVVSDPNADPHEYESNTSTARAISTADYIIINGAGYDSWADKLISAGTKSNAKVLNVANLLGKKEGDNPHFWYNPDYVDQVINQMKKDLVSIDSTDSAYYENQYSNLTASLGKYQSLSAEIKDKFGGTRIAATENIAQYLANATGLDLISPPAFMQAVTEGNDPPANSVVQFQEQLQSGNVSALIYNQQTVTKITDNMKSLATANGIPVVGITETVQPPNISFQDWMYSELINLQKALSGQFQGG